MEGKYVLLSGFLISFIISVALAPSLIGIFKGLKMDQTERKEGVKSHLKKAGTPTMGGFIFLIPFCIVGVILSFFEPKALSVILFTMGFGFIGFLDDYLKVVLKRSDGLLPYQKLILQFLVTTVFLIYILKGTNIGLSMIIPFTQGKTLDLGILAIPFMYVVVLATVNGVNFTDGLDGLAGSVTVPVAGFFMGASVLKGVGIATAPAVLMGALLGFLIYNAYPAKIFMGDTGSLALGGFVCAMAIISQTQLFIPIIGLIYAIELLSVVLQVGYFKITHGKRIFKMTPIHHHFELSGFSETRIVVLFCVITIIVCLLGFFGL